MTFRPAIVPRVIERPNLIRCEYAQRKGWPSTFRAGARVCAGSDRLQCRFHTSPEELTTTRILAATHAVQRMAQQPRQLSRTSLKNPMMAPGELTTREVLRQFPSSSLRPYQKQTIERIIQAFKSGKKCIVLTAPTGFGKSYVNVSFTSVTRSFLGLSTEETDVAAYLVLSRLRRIKEERLCPNFVMCFEEAQMFTRPEREAGTSSGSMLRFFALQGRFFGVGIGLISQKPSLLDATITSQAHTYVLGSMGGKMIYLGPDVL
jgi:hypothetical protein